MPHLLGPFPLAALGALSMALACTGESAAQKTPSDAPLPIPGSALAVPSGLAGRLTPEQHANIVLDVLEVELTEQERSPLGSGIPQEKPSTGLFRNGADGQAAADDYPLAFGKLAAAVAGRVDIAGLTAVFAPCSDPPDACVNVFVAELGKRLFRRPLTERETNAFVGLHASVVSEGLSFEQANRSVIEAMLQSPAFVFRIERETAAPSGEKRYLDGFELASRLAFFLWDSAPDAELIAFADSNALNGAARALPLVKDQVRRMLNDPRARRMTREFVTDFAETERASFVGMTPALRSALQESMIASVETHLWADQGQIKTLFTSTSMTLDPSVASLLGLTPTGDGHQVYDVSILPERVGWLTHPGFIAGIGDADVGKIVHRGIALMVKLMCRQPAQLPAGVAAAASEFNRAFAALSERQRSEQRRILALPASEGGGDNPACWGCHSQFEPLAYGFDRFDAGGRYRGPTDLQGRALPIDGWMTDDLSLPEAARARYANMAEFMALMADSETIQACMAEHFLAYATGRASTSLEKEFSFLVHSAQEREGGTLPAMVEAVATSEVFRALTSSAPAPSPESGALP